MRLIKKFRDGSALYFDKGAFDEWCVWYYSSLGKRTAPTDVAYFKRLKKLAQHFGAEKIYQDFATIYESTTNEISEETLATISRISEQYTGHQIVMEKLFCILYAGMIAEENKQGAILKKRIKRLGMHQVLIEDMPVVEAANYSKGRKWQALDVLCKAKGF